MAIYNEQFYKERVDSLRSAKEIVPTIIELIKPQSVVDVGCGTGEFLSVFIENGIKDILGIDGSWVPLNQLRIPKENFLQMDLENPHFLNKKFDLVISLEVAEHLSPYSTDKFISYLVSLSNGYILFSAAIPGQGGLNHINERWQEEWTKIFDSKGFIVVDIIRPKFWYNPNISFWYKQNAFLFVRKDLIENVSKILNVYKQFPLNVVHYELFEKKVNELNRIYKFIPKFILRLFSKLKKVFKD